MSNVEMNIYIYLEWLNNYVTVGALAETYNMEYAEALEIIEAGAEQYERLYR